MQVIWPKKHFVAIATTIEGRGRVGKPSQKTWLARMELCCGRLGFECSGFSASLQSEAIRYGGDFAARVLAILF